MPFSSTQFANKQDTELRGTRRLLRELNAEILNAFIEILDFKDYESKQRGINYDTFLHYYFQQAPQIPHWEQEIVSKNLFITTHPTYAHDEISQRKLHVQYISNIASRRLFIFHRTFI